MQVADETPHGYGVAEKPVSILVKAFPCLAEMSMAIINLSTRPTVPNCHFLFMGPPGTLSRNTIEVPRRGE